MGRVAGKVCLVTGGAMGIGAACARILAGEGARIVLTDIAEDEGTALARAIGSDARFIRHDVQSEEDWRLAIGAAHAAFGRLDVMVNNAGISEPGTIETTSLELWRRTLAINGDGVFLGCKYAVEAMKGHGGSIVNFSSSLGIRSNAGFAAYSASKGAVRLLTKSVALHCAQQRYKIRCNSIHPGAIRTPMFERMLALAPDRETGEKMFADNHPVGHVGEPTDVANAVLFLASDESAFVTGCELTVDGGLSIG